MNRELLDGLSVGGIALIAVAIAAVPLAVPTTSLRGKIESRVTHTTVSQHQAMPKK